MSNENIGKKIYVWINVCFKLIQSLKTIIYGGSPAPFSFMKIME